MLLLGQKKKIYMGPLNLNSLGFIPRSNPCTAQWNTDTLFFSRFILIREKFIFVGCFTFRPFHLEWVCARMRACCIEKFQATTELRHTHTHPTPTAREWESERKKKVNRPPILLALGVVFFFSFFLHHSIYFPFKSKPLWYGYWSNSRT